MTAKANRPKTPNVIGGAELVAKQSAVDAHGKLRAGLIHDLVFRPTRPVLHQRSADRLFVVSGLVRIVVFDGRHDSPTKGIVNEFTVSEKNPGLLIIPPNLYHGWKNLGTTEAIIVNMPTEMYDYKSPDALD